MSAVNLDIMSVCSHMQVYFYIYTYWLYTYHFFWGRLWSTIVYADVPAIIVDYKAALGYHQPHQSTIGSLIWIYPPLIQ